MSNIYQDYFVLKMNKIKKNDGENKFVNDAVKLVIKEMLINNICRRRKNSLLASQDNYKIKFI